MSIVIRPYSAIDIPMIRNIFHNAVHGVGIRYYTSEQVAAWAPPIDEQTPTQMEIELQRWQQKLDGHLTYVAEIDGVVVGFADMTQDGYLDHVYVFQNHQAKGIAYRLFKQLECIAKERGLTKITTHASKMAVPLAQRMGFVLIAEETVYRHGVAIQRYEMEKNYDEG